MRKTLHPRIIGVTLIFLFTLMLHGQTPEYNQQAREFYNKALRSIKVSNYSKALEALNMAIELNSNFIKAYIERGKVRLQ